MPPAKQPNIILILTDQQRGDCLGIEDHPVLQTPNLDHLAASGARFRRAYSECPSCIAARRSIMTGMSPAAQGMVGFQDNVDWEPSHTLAGELSKAGYQTEMIGKLHLSPRRRRFGFDHMQLSDNTRNGKHNDYTAWLEQKHHRKELDGGVAHGVSCNGWIGRPHHLPEEQMHTFWVINQAIEFLETRDPSAPFFLNLSFIDPHPPLTPPAFYYQRYIERELPGPAMGDWAQHYTGPKKGLNRDAAQIWLDEHSMRCCRAAYYGMINFIDDQIGRLQQYFQSNYSESLVLFASDHGEMLGDHQLFRKTFPYEASARVPFLVRAPRSWNCPEQVACSSPVGLQDIMPTILDAAGLDIPTTCTGKSLLPIVRGQAQAVRTTLHGEHSSCYRVEDANHFITDGRWKYIWYSITGREQLFDLEQDPGEMRDLARQEGAPERLAPWRAQLIQVLKPRPEGFTDGEKLLPVKTHGAMIPGYHPHWQQTWE